LALDFVTKIALEFTRNVVEDEFVDWNADKPGATPTGCAGTARAAGDGASV
jgi:hypothetical protein